MSELRSESTQLVQMALSQPCVSQPLLQTSHDASVHTAPHGPPWCSAAATAASSLTVIGAKVGVSARRLWFIMLLLVDESVAAQKRVRPMVATMAP